MRVTWIGENLSFRRTQIVNHATTSGFIVLLQENELKGSFLVDGVVAATVGSCNGGRISSGAAVD